MILQPGEINLKVPSDSGYLELIRIFVVQLAQKIGFEDDAIDQIELAVDEACTNVVKYAYEGRDDLRLDVTLQVDKQKLTVKICDYGIGFDPNAVERPEMKAYLAEFRTGGLGIYLMNTLMDEVSYDIEPGVKTEVRMTKYLQPIFPTEEIEAKAA